MPILDDTIAAIATAPGTGGLAVVRVSGPRALAVADAVFRGATSLASVPSHTLHHGWAVWPASAEAVGSARGALPGGRPAPHPAEPSSIEGELRHPWLPLALDAPQAAPPVQTPTAGAQLREPATDWREALPSALPLQRLDEVVAAVFRSPRSYTCEDVVEVSCHGGELPSRRVLSALLAAGARLAEPGEFTLRAFLHGRIDLSQAEAVADVIGAATSRAHELALSQLSGGLSRAVEALAERLTDAVAEVEARVDFAEDVGGIEVPAHVIEAIEALDRDLAALLGTAAWARALREGVRVPLIGRPNVGKSSLFNALLGEARAIVTAVPGTTRDRVSESVELAGIRVTLSDTAGLRETDDAVESLGVERAHEALAGAALALWVVDASAPLTEEDSRIAARLTGRRVLVALNKCDRPARSAAADVVALIQRSAPAKVAVPVGAAAGIPTLADGAAIPVVTVSATTGDGLDALRAALAGLLGARDTADGLGVAVSNLRHAEAIERSRAALARATLAAAERLPGEIVALELREALAALGEVTGRSVDDDLLERIFRKFCVGK